MTRVILAVISLATLSLTPFLFIGWRLGALTFDIPWAFFLVGVCCGGGLWLAQRGGWRWSRYIPPVMVLAIALIDTYRYSFGLTNVIEYSMAILLTTLLLDSRAQWVTLLLSTGGALLLDCLYFYHQGEAINLPDFGYWVAIIVSYFIIFTLLLRFFADQFRRALAQSRANSEALMQEINERQRAEDELRRTTELLDSVRKAQSLYIAQGDPQPAFDALLQTLVALTDSEFGFLDQVLQDADGKPYKLNLAISDFSWDQETDMLYEWMLDGGLEFRDLDNLAGMPALLQEPVIANDVPHDPRADGLPAAHPVVHTFMGLPVQAGGEVVGVVGVANRRDGYDEEMARFLEPYLNACASIIQAIWLRSREREAVAALRKSEELVRVAASSLDCILYVVDAELRFVLFKGGRLSVLDLVPDQVLGSTLYDLFQTTNPDHPLISPHLQALTGEVVRTETVQKGLTFSVMLSPMKNEQDDIIGVVGLALDITERKEIEERMQRQDRLAAIGQLAAGIAHDFRNLLTTIILYAQLGRRENDLAPDVAQHLEVIVGEARKATDLIKQILDFGRRTEIDRRPLDLVAFVQEVVAVLQRTLPETIHVTLDVGSETCMVAGDAGRLQQVLTNLAINARDAMPDGGDLCIQLTRIPVRAGATPPLPEMMNALAPPAWVCLSVADTGVGMTEEVRAHLFEPFFTTKEEGEGTGLGLAQVFGIIQLHAGYIDVETTVGQGTTFYIYLPASVATEETTEIAATAPTGQGETLLLVEDNAKLREAVESMLTDLGYRVLTAANGREALTLCQVEDDVALLITDLVMPNMGGKALMQVLRRRIPHLRALAMTGYTTEESIQSLQAAGFMQVIRKPFDADALAQAIQRALEEE